MDGLLLALLMLNHREYCARRSNMKAEAKTVGDDRFGPKGKPRGSRRVGTRQSLLSKHQRSHLPVPGHQLHSKRRDTSQFSYHDE